jgi:hypothetical protein
MSSIDLARADKSSAKKVFYKTFEGYVKQGAREGFEVEVQVRMRQGQGSEGGETSPWFAGMRFKAGDTSVLLSAHACITTTDTKAVDGLNMLFRKLKEEVDENEDMRKVDATRAAQDDRLQALGVETDELKRATKKTMSDRKYLVTKRAKKITAHSKPGWNLFWPIRAFLGPRDAGIKKKKKNKSKSKKKRAEVESQETDSQESDRGDEPPRLESQLESLEY